nr:agamous-like MADS-box protein AGL29 [Ipomoea batatas]
MAAYSWFDDCCTKLKAKKENHLMSANRVANEQMVSIPSFANVGAAQFDLNVTAANLVRGFNLNVAPSADDFCCISCSTENFSFSCFEFFLDIEGEPERKHKGRQKIEMKLIECENVRSVTFSKRKRTLFEKAKRAAASTGATIAIFLISSKEYMHAFGTSCVNPIINEYRARRSNDNVVIAVAQNDGQRLDLLNGDPFDKLKQILECQYVSFLLGPNFDRSNLEHHVMAAYSWFDDCCTKLKAKKEKHLMSANRVANELVVSIPSFAHMGAAQFDLNVTAANLGEPERKHKGRQKIEMKLIECENVRSVTFSKRKRTLFEKAKRAAASIGATIAIFLISSKEYMHAFGTSCVHPIINKYRARRSNDNVVIAVAQNDGQRLDLLNGDPFDKLKQILECQYVSFLLGPNFDRSNLEHHVMAAYSWFDDCCTKLKAKKEKHLMSANRVANEQMVVSIPSFANVGAAQFDLNVTAANLVRGFNLNVAPSVDDFCCISCSTFQSECDTGC